MISKKKASRQNKLNFKFSSICSKNARVDYWIELLEEKGFGNIKILCSEDKQEATKSYFDILPPSGILPGKINFITSMFLFTNLYKVWDQNVKPN